MLLWTQLCAAQAAPAYDADSLANPQTPPPSLGVRGLAQSLVDDAPARADFAVLMLNEMALGLATEVELAQQQQLSQGRDPGLGRWVRAVQRYIDELLRLADSISGDTPIGLQEGADGVMLLRVRRQLIVLSAPRAELQSSFEQSIVEQFCRQYPCAESIRAAATTSLMAGVASGAPPRWSFSADAGPACVSDDGLALHFETMAMLQRKREVCLNLVSEWRSISAELLRQMLQGVLIEWGALAIHAIPGDDIHQLDLNQRGDSLRLPLAYSASVQGLFERLAPWLRQRASGGQVTLVIEDAEILLAPLLDGELRQ